jgi:hypothetical protein
LDLNISTTLVELTNTASSIWAKEGSQVLQKPRGTYAPYRLRNRTGSTITVWADEETNNSGAINGAKILHDQSVDWRFDGWKTTREVCAYISLQPNTRIPIKPSSTCLHPCNVRFASNSLTRNGRKYVAYRSIAKGNISFLFDRGQQPQVGYWSKLKSSILSNSSQSDPRSK